MYFENILISLDFNVIGSTVLHILDFNGPPQDLCPFYPAGGYASASLNDPFQVSGSAQGSYISKNAPRMTCPIYFPFWESCQLQVLIACVYVCVCVLEYT